MRYVILGKGGHARALADMLDCGDYEGYTPYVMFGEDEESEITEEDELLIGVGDMETRLKLFEKYRDHKMAFGIQIMKGAIVYESAELGGNVLVNTGAQIDHECIIGDHCVISPGAVLCGRVTLGKACFVGASATILEGVTLEPGTFVPAGTLVVGPGDFRKPVRDLRTRDVEAALRASGMEAIGEINKKPGGITPVRKRLHPDL